jgi:signal recognition particle subunit SRP54
MREIRLALLEADVNFEVVKQFVAQVRERALGQEVLKSLQPGQQVVKAVHDELTALMGSGSSQLAFTGRPPTVILLAGLQGSGKTTAAAKLALLLRKEGRSPGLVAADLQRPAAIDQLEQLGKQINIPVYRGEGTDPVAVVRDGVRRLSEDGVDTIILDTAGRLHVDEELMQELERVRDEAKPANVLLVVDAMTGQEAVNVALAFQERIAFDGVVMTKLDGDARGGAALSVKAVTGRPIKLISVGEKLDQLEYFHPDRMASRILGMGDVLTLIERAEEAVEEDEQKDMEARMMKGQFTFRLGEATRGDGRGRREAARPGGSDHPLDDSAGAGTAEGDRRLAAPAHRARIGHDGGGSEPPDGCAQADGEAHEGHEQGQDAGSRGADGTDSGRCPAARTAKSDKIQQTQEATEIQEVIVWPYA